MNEQRRTELVEALTGALADLVRRHHVTEEEWYAALGYLAEVGQADQMILLSDVLGLSVMVDQQAHAGQGGTATNVLGPFWRPAPEMPNPAVLAPDGTPGEPLVVRGVVHGADGAPLPGARVDVWQCDADGRYDVQLGDGSEVALRGVLSADAEGRYEVHTIVPPPYEVPKDGPVGRLLEGLGRHAFRPAHIHLRVEAPNHADLTTMVFFAGDPWLGNDTINADHPALTVEIDRTTPPPTATFNIHLTKLPTDPAPAH